ncbi:hypothetical protein K458DRAFT_412008 [Lentithecium fluviatile CBS 122367]|uniref:Cell wall protein PhiA n=1 Tax=Lentithecium fluviatile CBS 122367 TaxID=1168545 RepID=A0A6G1JJA3_9PLEO|nr:hypothetical protein K458DRAFT_412008 [Lentithecium fluviatile CBS 122367]
MKLPTLLAASAFATAVVAAPVETLGSKHVVYLSTCVPNECPIGLCDPEDFNLIAAAYFRNGPPATSTASPTTLGPISSFGSGPASWEGTKRSVRLGTDGTYTSNIARGAKSLAKGEIAGDGELKGVGSEPFVCFKDGATKFRATYELDRYTCTADYYCPSIDAGTTSE